MLALRQLLNLEFPKDPWVEQSWTSMEEGVRKVGGEWLLTGDANFLSPRYHGKLILGRGARNVILFHILTDGLKPNIYHNLQVSPPQVSPSSLFYPFPTYPE